MWRHRPRRLPDPLIPWQPSLAIFDLATFDCRCQQYFGSGIPRPFPVRRGPGMCRFSFVALVLAASVATANDPRFRFTKGETLTYRMVRTTEVTETVLDEKT